MAFNCIHFQFNNDFYLRSGTSLVKYGTFNVIEMTSDEDKNIINKLSSDWIAPFYVNSSADVVEVKEITSITPNVVFVGAVTVAIVTSSDVASTFAASPEYSYCMISLFSKFIYPF